VGGAARKGGPNTSLSVIAVGCKARGERDTPMLLASCVLKACFSIGSDAEGMRLREDEGGYRGI
jgi:hypothetical protein